MEKINGNPTFASQGTLDQSVLTTWTLLFSRLQERSGHAAKLLILWGFLDHRDIWYDLFRPPLSLEVASELPTWCAKCVDDYSGFIEFTQIFDLYSFIDVKMGSSSFSVHPVLHQWCFQASGRNGLASVCISCIGYTSEDNEKLYPRREASLCFFLLREIIPKVSCNEKESSLNVGRHLVGRMYHNHGKLRAAEDMYVRALAGKEKALGPEHTSTLETVNNPGVLYQDQGKLREAEDMYVRALAGKEKALGPEHTSTVRARKNLANQEHSDIDVTARPYQGYSKGIRPNPPMDATDVSRSCAANFQENGR